MKEPVSSTNYQIIWDMYVLQSDLYWPAFGLVFFFAFMRKYILKMKQNL